jgi:hypothetical protein
VRCRGEVRQIVLRDELARFRTGLKRLLERSEVRPAEEQPGEQQDRHKGGYCSTWVVCGVRIRGGIWSSRPRDDSLGPLVAAGTRGGVG